MAQHNTPKLRFPEFSGAWEEKKLGDISELTSSKRVYLNDYVDTGIPFYRGKEISELKRNVQPKDILYISQDAYLDFKQKYGVPQENDILITAVGTLGNVLRISNNNPFYFKDGNLIWVRKINENSEFLEILLEFDSKKIENSAIGSSQKALTMLELRKLYFNFPTLPEQQKIASFLSAADKKLEQLQQKKTLLEQYKKGMMQKLFSQQIRFKDDEGKDFPEWEYEELGNLLKYEQPTRYIVNSTDYHESFNTPVLTAGKSFILGYTDEFENIYQSVPVIIFDDFTRANKWVDFPFKVKSSAMKILSSANKDVNIKYVFEAMQLIKVSEGDEHKRYWISEHSKIEIPFPSLAEQTKIAEFL
ncbi:MAG: restriction endonuclease subunit S, partial [Flavobacterium sp.]